MGFERHKTCLIYCLFEQGRSEEDRALLLWGIVTCREVWNWACQFSQWKFGTSSALVSVKRAVLVFVILRTVKRLNFIKNNHVAFIVITSLAADV